MNLELSPEERAFREEVRAWLRRHLPRRRARRSEAGWLREQKAWQRKLLSAGYLAMGWPREFGGQASSDADHVRLLMRQTLLNEELVRSGAPGVIGMMGIQMVGPTLMQFGTEVQKHRFLPPILSADEIWCQGYSEPGAGSDLASLRTRAEVDGDFFVVNGRKVWTSNADLADWMFCLVRTDTSAPRHRGISYLLIDMNSPGIEVRPLVQMTGDRGFNEVLLEDVKVPRENLVGELNEGWKVTNATLAHERNMLGSTTRTQQLFARLFRLARTRRRDGVAFSRHPAFRHRLAELEIRVETMKLHAWRQLTDALHGRPPGIAASVNKLVSTELNHAITELALEILGNQGPLERRSARTVDHGIWAWEHMFTLGMIIGGGTSQIQKNIIAERGLGMPRR